MMYLKHVYHFQTQLIRTGVLSRLRLFFFTISLPEEPRLISGNFMCDLFRTKQHWDNCTFEYLGLPLSVIILPMFHIRIYLASTEHAKG
jgi:hypothetical protein